MARKTPPKGGKSKARSQPAKAAPEKASFAWLVPVAALSAFVGFIIYLGTYQGDQAPVTPAEPVTSQPATPRDSGAPQERDFRFYDMLPESSVVTPDMDAYEPGPGAAELNIEYILQTGSFRSEKDAEQQRAQVGFQGLRARISSVSTEAGGTWYRVEAGPYTDRSEMNRAIDRLVSINIQPLVRQRSAQSTE
ncbi:MAG: sporulation protein [Halomonadaceae bacterium]|nr:MAG: sporulation protein [Halomonadaceae bacterium]